MYDHFGNHFLPELNLYNLLLSKVLAAILQPRFLRYISRVQVENIYLLRLLFKQSFLFPAIKINR